MEKQNNYLVLQKLVFDEIQFKREGFKNKNKIEYSVNVQIGVSKDDEHEYRVTLMLVGDKKDEYKIQITLLGFFKVENIETNSSMANDLINKNAVAIMWPYMRSQLTLLTSQPEMDCVVMPIVNMDNVLTPENRTESQDTKTE